MNRATAGDATGLQPRLSAGPLAIAKWAMPYVLIWTITAVRVRSLVDARDCVGVCAIVHGTLAYTTVALASGATVCVLVVQVLYSLRRAALPSCARL